MSADLVSEMARRSHDQRKALTEEMHNRKLPAFSAPARLLQVVVQARTAELDQATEIVRQKIGQEISADAPLKHAIMTSGGIVFEWERHSEFATYTFLVEGAFDDPFDTAPFADVLREWLPRMPGEVIRSSQIAVRRKRNSQGAEFDPMPYFSAPDLIFCDVASGNARVWSDFRLHGAFGRMMVEDRGLHVGMLPLLIQTLLEFGNYRKLALLGLPVAQSCSREIDAIEAELADLNNEVANSARPSSELLSELTDLSARVAHILASTHYRMGATQAYAEICDDRIASLQLSSVAGTSTLKDFTARRLHPAVTTCANFSRRLQGLSQRLAWTTDLLRTRVDTGIAMQNRDLLYSLDRRNEVQLRLQQTVEGLSLAAISYYLVGLAGYVAKALHEIWPGIEPNLVMGAAVPVTLLGLVLAYRRWHVARGQHAADRPAPEA